MKHYLFFLVFISPVFSQLNGDPYQCAQYMLRGNFYCKVNLIRRFCPNSCSIFPPSSSDAAVDQPQPGGQVRVGNPTLAGLGDSPESGSSAAAAAVPDIEGEINTNSQKIIQNPNKALWACCRNQDIEQPVCKQFCRYNVTWQELTGEFGLTCLPFVSHWQYCTSNAHQDSTDCCVVAGVPAPCLQFCQGKLPENCAELLGKIECPARYLTPILQCQKQTATNSAVRWRRNGAPRGCV